MMDLGADLCGARDPACMSCPVAQDCVARIEERVGELPGRRARAAVRRRQVAMLVMLSGGEVLLEKRPSSGIWGGLWSLPEAPVGGDPGALLRRRYGIDSARITPLEPFEHAFTHFTLEVTPWRIDIRKPPAVAAERGTTWISLGDIAGAALPSPVKKLLRGLSRSASAGEGSGGGSPGAARAR
jgi:A/G-specific adenine glycosylase